MKIIQTKPSSPWFLKEFYKEKKIREWRLAPPHLSMIKWENITKTKSFEPNPPMLEHSWIL